MKSTPNRKDKGLSLSELLVAIAVTWVAFAYLGPKLTESPDVAKTKRDLQVAPIAPEAPAVAAKVPVVTVATEGDGCSEWATVFGPVDKTLANTAATHMAHRAERDAQFRFRSTEKRADPTDQVWIVEKRTCP